MLMKYIFGFLNVFCLINFVTNDAKAQIPTVQDCLGAIPVCQDTFVQNNAFSGTGNYPGEITYPLSCLQSGEKNDVWYTFTVQNAGILEFSITPNNPNDDYDWAVFDLTNHLCSDIATTPLQVSCNYAGNNGGGGITGANGGAGQQSSPVFAVTAGSTYVLNVSNYTSTQSGYILDFTPSTAQIYDNIKPTIDSTNTQVSCGDNTLSVYFSENIYCSSVQASDFTLSGPGGPYTVNSVSGTACAIGADYGNTYIITFSPAINIGGAFSLTLVDTVYDLCYNAPVLPTVIPVNVNTVLFNTTQVDVSCFGGSNGTATVTPSGNYTYSWNTSPVQTTQTATGLSAGNVTVTVTPPIGCPGQAIVSIIEPTVIDTISTSTTSTNCGTANGSAAVTITGGTVPYTYQWAPLGGTASSASNITGGAYTVTVTDQRGCTMTVPLTVAFQGMTAAITVQQDVKCFGGNDGSATVAASVGSGNYTYQWYTSSSVAIGGATNASVSGLSVGSYFVIVNDIQGCKDTVQLTISQPASALSGVLNTVSTSCGGNNGSITIAPSGGTLAYTFLWSNAATANNITNLSAGNYTVTITDGNGCTATATDSVKSSTIPLVNLSGLSDVTCFGGNDGKAQVNPSGGILPYTLSWSNGSSLASVTNLTAGIYVVTVSDNTGCTATESFTINQASQLILNASVATTICIGDSANIAVVANGGTPPYTYLWSNGNTSNGQIVNPITTVIFNVTVTDSIGCPSAASSITVTVRPPLAVSIFSDSTICRGSTIVIPANASGGDGVYAYNWNNGLSSGQSITITPTQDTTLSVIVSDNCGTPNATASVNILLIDAPVVDFGYAPDAGCEPLTVTFTDSSQTIANSAWLWSFGGGLFSTQQNPVHVYQESGLYDVTLKVTNPFGCSKSITKNQIINVYKRPVPSVDFDPKTPTLYNPTVTFTDRSPGATIWAWDFGDNTPGSSEQNPVHTYADTGIYRVKLVLSNLQQCTDSIEFNVHVQDEYSFYLPTAFTPNGNGKNDYFNVYGVGVKSFEVSIFNRWGALVQKTKDQQSVWDGRVNGAIAEEGVYVYVVNLVEQNGRKHRVKGHVTLIR